MDNYVYELINSADDDNILFRVFVAKSIIGLFLAVCLSVPYALILMPLFGLIATLPSKSLQKRMGEKFPDWLSPGAFATFLFIELYRSTVFCFMALQTPIHTQNIIGS